MSDIPPTSSKPSKTNSPTATTGSRSSPRSSPPSAPRPASPTSARSRSPTSRTSSCVELKSLKLYLQSFRNEGIFYEHVTNTILDDLVAVAKPRCMKLVAAFTARGGITTTVTAEFAATLP